MKRKQNTSLRKTIKATLYITERGAVRACVRKSSAKIGEVAIGIEIEVPLTIFNNPALCVKIVVPEKPTFDVGIGVKTRLMGVSG